MLSRFASAVTRGCGINLILAFWLPKVYPSEIFEGKEEEKCHGEEWFKRRFDIDQRRPPAGETHDGISISRRSSSATRLRTWQACGGAQTNRPHLKRRRTRYEEQSVWAIVETEFRPRRDEARMKAAGDDQSNRRWRSVCRCPRPGKKSLHVVSFGHHQYLGKVHVVRRDWLP